MDVIRFAENLLTSSGLFILLCSVISLPDATLMIKNIFHAQLSLVCCLSDLLITTFAHVRYGYSLYFFVLPKNIN